LIDNLFLKVYTPLLAAAKQYTSLLKSVDDRLGSNPFIREAKDTGVETLSNAEFYNKYVAKTLRLIPATFVNWTIIRKDIINNMGITTTALDNVAADSKNATDHELADLK